MTEARPSNYWIASNALYITLNANGGPDYLLGNTASGAHILCYMKGIDGLEYDAGHNYRRWPLSLTPTHFETYTEKYVYCAIPRPGNAAEMAVIVFPSERLDIYGKNETGQQIGSEQYYYIWLHGIISSSGVTGANDRAWTQHIDTGTLASDEAMNAGGDETWWRYSSVDDTVTFLKEIVMDAKSVFHNLKARLLVLAGHELTGVATADTSDEFVDSETLVVTPSYLKKNTEDKFLRKDQDDSTPYSLTVGGNLSVGGILRAMTGYFTSLYSNLVQSTNYTGEGIADTGYRLTADDGTGSSALIVDNLHVRKKATFEELEVKKETSVAGNEIRSAAANVINRTDYIDQNGEIIGYSYHTVPWMLRKMPFLLRHKFFGRLRRVRISIDPEHVSDIKKIRCYFLAKDGDRDVKNLWRAHDLVRCQTFNITRSNRYTYIGTASQSKFENVFWWRKAVLVSTSPVAIDDKEYHYFDVSMEDCAAGSDIPCAGDHAVQFGNDSDSERMNLIIQEVNGTDAPAIKAYTGIYTYDLNKCWWGGSPRKMMLSPKSGYEFYGPSFKFVQEYGQAPASIDRGAWVDIPTERDDYEPHAQVRKCYYYDKVSHNGCYWLCVMSQVGAHWVDASGNYLTQAQYDALSADQKLLCTRRQNYVTSQPGTDDTAWKKLVDKGDNMVRLDIDNEMDTVQTDSTGKVTAQRTVTTVVRLYDGSSEVAIDNPTVTGITYTDADGHQQTLQPTITASGNGRQLSWTFQAGWTLQGRYQVSIGYTYQNVTYTAVFTLTASQGMAIFQLKPAMNAISFQRDADGNPTPDSKSLALDIIKIDGASTATITPATYGRTKIRYSLTEMPTLVTSGTAWPSTGSISVPNTAENVYIALFNIYDGLIDRESVPVIKDGEKGQKGDKGDQGSQGPQGPQGPQGSNGDDAWSVAASPSPLIINQNIDNASDFGLPIEINFTGKCGDNTATVGTVNATNSMGLGITAGSGKITITSYSKVNGAYVTSGVIVCTVPLTYDSRSTNFTFRISVGVNMIGQFSDEIKGDMRTELARSTLYKIEDGVLVETENWGEFYRSSTENISRLTKQVNNGKNLLSGVLTAAGWKSGNSPYNNDAKVDNDGWINAHSGDYTLKSPVFAITSGKYTLSLEAESQSSISCAVFPSSGGSPISEASIPAGSGRRSVWFTVTSSTDVYILISATKIRYPQLEIGTAATAFDAGATEVSSEIKQTADEIDASVRNDLNERVGIDIRGNNRSVNIQADSVNMNRSTIGGTPTMTLQSSDSAQKIVFETTPVTDPMTGQSMSGYREWYGYAATTTLGGVSGDFLSLGARVKSDGSGEGRLVLDEAYVNNGEPKVRYEADMEGDYLRFRHANDTGSIDGTIEIGLDGANAYLKASNWPSHNSNMSSGRVYIDANGYLRVKGNASYLPEGAIPTNASTLRRVGSSTTLDGTYETIICLTNNITLTLPSNPVNGQKYTIIPNNGITLRCGNSQHDIKAPDGDIMTSKWLEGPKFHFLIFDATDKRWYLDWGS